MCKLVIKLEESNRCPSRSFINKILANLLYIFVERFHQHELCNQAFLFVNRKNYKVSNWCYIINKYKSILNMCGHAC